MTIDSMVEKFQNEEVLNSVGEDLVLRNLLGEVEVNSQIRRVKMRLKMRQLTAFNLVMMECFLKCRL